MMSVNVFKSYGIGNNTREIIERNFGTNYSNITIK